MTTRAIDIDCPKPGCGARAGEYCNGQGVGVDLCQARINAAAAKTRAANRAKREAARRG